MSRNLTVATAIEDHVGRYSEGKNLTKTLNRKEDLILERKIQHIAHERNRMLTKVNRTMCVLYQRMKCMHTVCSKPGMGTYLSKNWCGGLDFTRMSNDDDIVMNFKSIFIRPIPGNSFRLERTRIPWELYLNSTLILECGGGWLLIILKPLAAALR